MFKKGFLHTVHTLQGYSFWNSIDHWSMMAWRGGQREIRVSETSNYKHHQDHITSVRQMQSCMHIYTWLVTWSKVTFLWSEVTSIIEQLTFGWNELTGVEMTMGWSDQIPYEPWLILVTATLCILTGDTYETIGCLFLCNAQTLLLTPWNVRRKFSDKSLLMDTPTIITQLSLL